MPRFFVPSSDIAAGQASLKGGEFRHLQRVLRLREGDHVTLFDDAGEEHEGIILALSPRVATVRITSSAIPGRESRLAITLYQGLPKGRKMDLVVEKATELGVYAVTPFASAFGVRTLPTGAAKRERWQRIALAAAKQSGRAAVPAIADARAFTEAIANATDDLKLLFFEGPEAMAVADAPEPRRPPQTAAIFVGPEGGFSADEVAAARTAGFLILGVGPRILRTETAGLVAVTLVQARWGDLGARTASQGQREPARS